MYMVVVSERTNIGAKRGSGARGGRGGFFAGREEKGGGARDTRERDEHRKSGNERDRRGVEKEQEVETSGKGRNQ